MNTDLRIRLAAFSWLEEQTSIHGDVLPRTLLAEGYTFEGQRVPLISPQGIFKPRIMELPLSITTSPDSPYDDNLSENGFLYYKYRGTDPNHRDNVGLREVFKKEIPLIYLHGIMPGRYLTVWPVYIIGDDPNNLSFKIVIDDHSRVGIDRQFSIKTQEIGEARREYITSTFQRRLHQRSFREKVLEAYQDQCAFCKLRHRELLDAAHIIPDRHPESKPTVDNGLALCKIHHAAYDSFIIGVTPEYIIKVREDILIEEDGPILQHGIIRLHESAMMLPVNRSNWPSQQSLSWKYDHFLLAEQ
jgi:putative restriction endonuclease